MRKIEATFENIIYLIGHHQKFQKYRQLPLTLQQKKNSII